MTFEAPRPLSQAQLGIWLGHQRASEPAVYNACQCTSLRGNADARLLQEAIEATLGEAPELHLCVVELGGVPCLVAGGVEPKVVDTGRTLSAFELPFYALSRARAPLDLPRGELVRHEIVRLEQGGIAWIHIAHHLALDGYGFALITRRVAEHYSALAANSPAKANWLTPLTLALEEDSNYQSSAQRAGDEAYFRSYLGGFSGQSVWPRRTPTWPRQHGVHLPAERHRPIAQAAQLAGGSWSELLIAASARVLARLIQQRTLVFGMAHMQRIGRASARTPCMAMNILPIAIDVEDKSLEELMAEVRGSLHNHRAHQRFRYEHQRSAEGTARSFDAVVNIMPFDSVVKFAGCQVEVLDVVAGPVENLSISCIVQDGKWKLRVDGHPELFTQRDTAQLSWDLLLEMEQLGHVGPTNTPRFTSTEQAGELAPRAEDADRDQVSPDRAQGADPVDAFFAQADRQPAALALIDGSREITYAELAQNVRQLASALRPFRSKVVAVELPRGAAAVSVQLALLHVGATFLMLDAEQPGKRTRAIVKQAQPELILRTARGDASTLTHSPESALAGDAATQPCEEDGPAALELLLSSGLPQLNGSPPSSNDVGAENPEGGRPTPVGSPAGEAAVAPAYLIFTSGSTGAPKGIAVSRRALAHFVAAAALRYEVGASDRVLQFAALTFDASIEELYVTLSRGATLVIRQEGWLNSVAEFLDHCQRTRISILDLPTAYFHELAHAFVGGRATLPKSLRTIIIGGEAARHPIVSKFLHRAPHVHLINSYGPSEATVVATSATLDATQMLDGNVPIGVPLEGVGALIQTTSGRLTTRPFEEGELLLAGPSLADGYVGLPEETNRRFTDLAGCGRVYRTGDLACYGLDGQLYYRARLDEEQKIAGHRVHPAEVETALLSHPAVSAAVAGGVDDAGTTRWIAVCEVLSQGQADEVTPDALLRFVRKSLPAAMVPQRLFFRERLARTTSGKVDRRGTLQDVTTAFSCVEPPAAEELWSEPLMRTVVACWREVLGHASIQPDDDFFALGGSSLQVIQLANRLSQAGHELKVADIFQLATPRAQALALREGRKLTGQADFQPLALSPRIARATAADRSAPILLTGATGYVGIYLLSALLARTNNSVTCLVRAADNELARERLFSVAETHGLLLDPTRVSAIAVPGSASRGGSPDALVGLDLNRQGSFSHLLHCAAEVSLTRDYASLANTNVSFTHELLEAAGGWGSAFHLVSTIATIPRATLKAGAAEELYGLHTDLVDGYQQTKAHAEDLCRNAAEQGLPVAIYRLGRVVAARQEVRINERDLVWSIARSASRLGAWPDLNVAEPWTPVDDVATALVDALVLGSATSEARRAQSAKSSTKDNQTEQPDALERSRPHARVYHVTAESLVTLDSLHASLDQSGLTLPRVPVSEFAQRLSQSADPKDNALAAFFAQRAGHAPTELIAPPQTNRLHTLLGRPPVGPVDAQLLRAYVEAAQASGLLSPSALPAALTQINSPFSQVQTS